MRTRFRVGLALVSVVVALSVAGYAVAASIASDFVGSGSTRYAMVAMGPETSTTTTSIDFVDIADMSVVVGIPSNKMADLIITFSAEVNTCDAMFVRATIDGTAAAPSYTQFQWNFSGGADSHSFTFFQKGIGSGSHTVAMQWHGLSTCVWQFMAARSLIVTANIH